MSEGVRSFTTEGQVVAKYENKPFPKGDYQLKLLDNFEVKKAQGSAPRVSTRWEVLNTGKDGKKNRLLFHDFYTSLRPGADGVAMVNRGSQIVAFSKAIGERFTAPVIDVDTDNYGTVQCLDPRQLMKWLQAKAGQVVNAHVKVRGAKDGYEARNELDNFIADESAAEGMSGLEDSPLNGASRLSIQDETPA